MPSAAQRPRPRMQLTRRLVPVTLLIGGLISLGFPAAYYVLDVDDVARLATADARELADRLGPLLVEVPSLWKYQAPKYRQLLDEFVRHREVTTIQVRDGSGEPVPEYAYPLSAPEGTWTGPVSFGTAPLFANNQRMGSVSVGISQAPLLWATLRLFLVSTVVGVGVALVAYLYPAKVARSLEGRVEELADALTERTRQLEAVRAVTVAIAQDADDTAIFSLISQRAAELVGAVSGTVRLWDEKDQVLIPVAWHGVGEWIRDRRLRLGEGISGRVAQRREGLIVNEYRTSFYADSIILRRTGITAVLAEPILYRGRLLGVLTVAHEEAGRAFTKRDRDILPFFVAQAAVVIENARLHKAAVPPGK